MAEPDSDAAGEVELHRRTSADEADNNDRILPPVSEGEKLDRGAVKPEQHFTKPPPRFTEASLVKRLEELAIRTAPIADELRELTKDGEFVDEQKESGFGATPPETARYIDGVKCRDLVPKLEVVARLPLEGWRFKADPKGVGTAKGFYKPDFPSDDLTSIRISEFWDTQGYKKQGDTHGDSSQSFNNW